MNNKVFISGGISNNPNYEKDFGSAYKLLKETGWDAVNPIEDGDHTYREFIDMALLKLMQCDSIYMLRGWENSIGSSLEHTYAETVGMNILYQSEVE